MEDLKKIMIANQSKWLPIFKRGILQRKARCAYKHPIDFLTDLFLLHILSRVVSVSHGLTPPQHMHCYYYFLTLVLLLLVGSIGDGVCVSCFLHLPNPPTGIVPGHHLGIPTPWLSTDMSSPFIKGVCSVFAQKQTYLGRPPP